MHIWTIGELKCKKAYPGNSTCYNVETCSVNNTYKDGNALICAKNICLSQNNFTRSKPVRHCIPNNCMTNKVEYYH